MASYLAEVVGFLALIVLTYHYLWPMLRKMMDQQEESIRSSLASADKARDGAKSMLVEAHDAVGAAQGEVAVILERARETSAQIVAEGERRGHQEHQRLLANAALEAEFERSRAREKVSRQIGVIVMAATERVVAAEIDHELQEALVQETIDAAEAMA